MKTWKLFAIAIVLSIFFYYAHVIFCIDYAVKQRMSYKNCETTYRHSYTDFYFANRKTFGHSYDNELEILAAQHRLLNCLCCEYSTNKDPEIKSFIMEHFMNDVFHKEDYRFFVFIENAPVDSIVKYEDILFKGDSIGLMILNDYKITNDAKKLIQFYKVHLVGDYNKLQENMEISTYEIDSICKYREFIFDIPRID